MSKYFAFFQWKSNFISSCHYYIPPLYAIMKVSERVTVNLKQPEPEVQ